MMYKDKKWLQENLLKYNQQEMANICGIHVGTIETYVKKYNLKGYKLETLEKANTADMTINSPQFCYLLGLFVTDGNFSLDGRVSIQQNHKHPLEVLQKTFGGNIYHRKNSTYVYVLTQVTDIFTKLGFTQGEKTFTVETPSELVGHKYEYLYVRGMVDGDGTISLAGKTRFFTASEKLKKYYQDFLDRNNISYGTYPQSCGHSIECTGGFIEKTHLGIILYQGYEDLVLPHKRERMVKIIDDIVRTYEMINHKK